MSHADIEKLKSVKDFDGLVEYLMYELDWPIEADNADDITFKYRPEELGIESGHAAKIKTIKQIRPLTDTQPYGVFYIEFEPKKLPVVVLRRILRSLVTSKRGKSDGMATWDMGDLLFITTLGEVGERATSVARFSQTGEGLPEIRAISWDETDTYFHYEQNIFDLDKLRWPTHEEDTDAWREQWKSAFPLKHREVITTSQRLATEMAQLARRIRDQIKLVHQYETRDGPLHSLYENFRSVLIHDLTIADFADMYAQTVAYGLFSASCTQGEFSVKDVPAMVPNTNPFLKKLFEECTRIGEHSRDAIDLEELGVSELVEMLKASNIKAVLQDFGKQKKGEDPVIHFYELFLKEYDPDLKVERGVFYTPDPVVSFIVRSVDYMLRTEFDCPDGLADTSTDDTEQVPKVQILDPATGTGTFLKYVIAEIKKTFDEKHKLSEEELREKWNEYVPEHLLPRVFGFELMMAPYAVAHLKLGLELKETGYDFKSEKRLEVYLTNTLEGTHKGAGRLDAYYNWLAEEVNNANTVKTKPILAIIGNPPYSGISKNMGNWIKELVEDYKYVDGEHFGERKHWLQDDYVKFIRFGQWKIDRTGEGVLGFITNHSYIDNPTFRGMRQSLMNSFDEIYVLNLHGNSLKKEKCPDGSKDENVFDIRQGVAIGLFIKKREQNGIARVYYAERWGLREDKYKWLLRSDITTTGWEELKPNSPFYFFVPREETGREDYEKYWKVTDIFPVNSVGIVTARDKFVIDFDIEALKRRIEMFRDLSISDEVIKQTFKLKDTSTFKLIKSRERLYKDDEWEKYFTEILYRPFDKRAIYYTNSVVERPLLKVMRHMVTGGNLGLITHKREELDVPYSHFFVTNFISEHGCLSSKTTCYHFPLYLYPHQNKKKLLNSKDATTKTQNLNPELIKSLTETYGKELTPEEIFYYIYAVLYSNTYRTKYAEFLKIDFPRVPFTSDYDLFKTLSRLGSELVSLHLMESPELDDLITEFRGGGDDVVAIIGKNSYEDGRLEINKTQYFEGMPEEVYNFHIGGYQVCQKWLKDHKGRALSEEDILHYQKIVVALNETIRIMKEIDEAIDGHGGWPIR